MSHDRIDADLVLALARLAGIPLPDAAAAERIAAGAGAAIAAVRAQREGTLFEVEPADFLPTLERLAAPVDGREP